VARLEGRVAIVTGGAKGIGLHYVRALAAEGARLMIADIADGKELAESLARAYGANSVASTVTDVADEAAVKALVAETMARFGQIDVLVNNAALFAPLRETKCTEIDAAVWDRVMAINLRGPFFLTQRFAKKLIDTPPAGFARTIVSIASINATHVSPNRADYCLSKGGVSMMTRLFALKLAEHGIGVHEIRPGVIRTDMTAPVRDEYQARIDAGLSPIKRWGEPADIGRAVAALATGAFAFSTGDAYHIDGGYHIASL